METKSIIIATFNANRAANLAHIEYFYEDGQLSKAQFVKAAMAHLVTDKMIEEFEKNTCKFETDQDALKETIESAAIAVLFQSNPAILADIQTQEKRETREYQTRSFNNHQRSCRPR